MVNKNLNSEQEMSLLTAPLRYNERKPLNQTQRVPRESYNNGGQGKEIYQWRRRRSRMQGASGPRGGTQVLNHFVEKTVTGV